jgi:hypothetical protein
MSAQDRKILQATLLNFFSSGMQGVDPEKFFKAFHGKSLAFMAQVFGKEHAAKFMDLLKQWEHFQHNLDNIREHSDGALDRKWSIFGEGFAFEWQRASAAVDNFMNSIGGSGIREDMAGLFRSIADMFDSAQKVDPETLRAGFWGIASVAAIAPAGYAINGILAGLKLIRKFSPVVISIAGAYLLYDVWKNWDKLQKSKDRISFTVDLVLNDMLPSWAKNLIETGANQANQGAFDNQLQNRTHGGRLQRFEDWMAGKSHEETFSPFGGGGAKSPLQLLDLHAQQINVTGSAEIRNKVDLSVKVDGGTVTKQQTLDGRAEVPLNTGRSMSDTDKSYGHAR